MRACKNLFVTFSLGFQRRFRARGNYQILSYEQKKPIGQPIDQLIDQPTNKLTSQPTDRPTNRSTNQPTDQPTRCVVRSPAPTPAATASTPSSPTCRGAPPTIAAGTAGAPVPAAARASRLRLCGSWTATAAATRATRAACTRRCDAAARAHGARTQRCGVDRAWHRKCNVRCRSCAVS